MSYYFSKTLSGTFEDALTRVTQALAAKGFGVLTSIDVSATMQKKLGASMRPYTILGACNPKLAFQALQAEDKIGTMLPCNVVVRQTDDERIEVAAVDPVASMMAIQNPGLGAVAAEVRGMLKDVVDGL